jgi:type I restriction enzyme S subunit
MRRKCEPLGKLCNLVKGISPISRTPPGPYPLITTGEEQKTANTFQFNAEAVCIPLVSSTGHGHASLKRVHYQTGRFALANILAAALVKDRSVLSARFLARYLSFVKDRLIVPLMTGAANMSISVDRLATVPVEFPTLAEQECIANLLDEADELRRLRAQTDRRTYALIPAIFHEMFGNPIDNSRSWPVHEIRQLGRVVTGSTPPSAKKGMFGGEIPFITPGDLESNTRKTRRYVTEAGAAESRTARSGSTLVCCIGATIGKTDRTWERSAFNQQINAIEWGEQVDDDFGLVCMRQCSSVVIQLGNAFALPILKKSLFEQIQIPLPPLSLQREFATQVAEIRELESGQAASRQRMDALFQSLLHHAFQGDL